MTALPDVDQGVHLQVLEQVMQGCELAPIADRLKIDLRIVRELATRAGAPDLGEVRGHLQRMQAAQVPEPDRITRTSGGDRVGREVVYSDADVAHQIRLTSEGGTACKIGCTCGAPPARQGWLASEEEMWSVWAALAHRTE